MWNRDANQPSQQGARHMGEKSSDDSSFSWEVRAPRTMKDNKKCYFKPLSFGVVIVIQH